MVTTNTALRYEQSTQEPPEATSTNMTNVAEGDIDIVSLLLVSFLAGEDEKSSSKLPI